MANALQLLVAVCQYAYRKPASIVFSFAPAWYIHSTVTTHALKTPLTTLSLALAEAKQSHTSPGKLRIALEHAEQARLKLQRLLLHTKHQVRPFDAATCIDQVARWYSSLGYEIKVINKCGKRSKLKLNGDAFLFEQLLEILIDNAIAAGKETENLVVLSVLNQEHKLHLIVQDFGHGMSLADLLLCEVKPPASTGQHWGIGLTCARRIAWDFRGKIEIDSWEQIGTQIKCTFPLVHG